MNIQEMMRQAQRMKSKIDKVQQEVGERKVQGTAGGGMVEVEANGKNEVLAVKIEPEVVNPEDIEMLQDLIVAATNQALTRAQEMMQEEVGKVTGGLGIPGLM